MESGKCTYDLLIIMKETEKQGKEAIIKLAEKQATQSGYKILGVVHKVGAVNKAIAQGNRFFLHFIP